MHTEDYRAEHREIAGVKIRVISYRIGESYYCHVENLDPGATIARAEADTREEAISAAVHNASERLTHTAAKTR